MYTRVGLKAWVITLALLFFGGSGKAAVTQVVERDSAGVRIVENPTPEGAQPLTWQVHPEPVLDLATTGEGPEHEFYRVNSGFRMDDGRIVVANRGSSEVRVYSQEGEFLQALGGRGEGPAAHPVACGTLSAAISS